MAGDYDSGMKRLVKINPADYVSWLVQDAIFLEEYNPHLPNRSIDADSLLKAAYKAAPDLPFLGHIEFQTRHDPEMAKRLWEYNVSASIKYDLPTRSFVIYLRPTNQVATTPYQVKIPDGEEIHRFHFGVVKLWEISAEELRKTGLTGLLALLPLTKDGARPEVVETMINDLQRETEGETQRDLLSIGLTFATLVFKRKDQDWLIRRISMLEDILEESPFYQQILHRGEEKGRAEALRQAHQELLRTLRQMLVDAVQDRFPQEAALILMVRGQASIIEEPEVLKRFILKVGALQTPDEVQKLLLSSERE
jgi:predicted transposase YdaD